MVLQNGQFSVTHEVEKRLGILIVQLSINLVAHTLRMFNPLRVVYDVFSFLVRALSALLEVCAALSPGRVH